MLKVEKLEDIIHVKTFVSRLGQRLSVHLYTVDGLLIDTGPSRAQKALIPFFKEVSMEQVALTHHHEDHTGNAPWIQQHCRIPVYIHPLGQSICHSRTHLPLYRRLFWGNREAFQPQIFPELIETNRFQFQIVHTPGHAEDHIVLIDEANGRLFSGDLYLTSRPKTMLRYESVPDHIESLRKVLSFDFDTVFCGHAGVVKQGKRMIEAKLAHLEELQDEVLRLYRKGMSVKQICKKLYPHKDPITYFSANEMSSANIVKSVIRHQQ